MTQKSRKKSSRGSKQELSPEGFLIQCRSSYEFFAERILKIQTKSGHLVPFRFNRVQRVLWLRMLEKLKAGEPMRWLILKGRQMGMSTFIAGFIYWVISQRSNRNAIVAAHDEKSAANLFQKQQLFYRESPENFRPMHKTMNRGQLYFANPDPRDNVPGLESGVIVETANNVNLGRSFTLHFLHWSEFAMALRPKETLAAVRNSMPKTAGTGLFIETTAKGPGYFKELWDEVDNDFVKLFICWVADDTYRTEIAKEDYFEPHDVDHPQYGNEAEEASRIRAELINWYPENADDGSWLDHEVMCRLAWRRETIINESGGDLRLFRQEYPTIPSDAFLGTGRSVFDTYKLSDLMANLHANPPTERRYRFDFKNNNFYEARYGPLVMYEPIVPDATYVIGADPALGVKGGDPSAAVVLRCPELAQAGEYCAITPPDDFATLLFHWGLMLNSALLGVENNEQGGWSINAILGGKELVNGERLRYPRLYKQDIDDKIHRTVQQKYGWKTNSVTKDIMITDLRNGITEDIVVVRSIDTMKQLMNYQEIVTPSGRKSTGVPEGSGNDDLAVALMIAYQMASRGYHQAIQKTPKMRKYSLKWWERVMDNEASAITDKFSGLSSTPY